MSVLDYGLIGHPLEHSLSPFIHQRLLGCAGLPGIYRLYDIKADQLEDTVNRLSCELAGYNCTIPYKEAIIPYLKELDETADYIRSVNTVKAFKGYNTDYAAFNHECPLKKGQNVLLLGAGGISRTMAFAAAEAGCKIWIVARRKEQAVRLGESVRKQNSQAILYCSDSMEEWRQIVKGETAEAVNLQQPFILLNGTPVGMWPKVSGLWMDKEDLNFISYVYDTIYNPVATRLVLLARSRQIPAKGGLGMLFQQALAAQKIWNPTAVFPESDLLQIRRDLAQAIFRLFPVTIVLCGFMGSGKTTVGRLLSKKMSLPFLDLDAWIEQKAGRAISEIFAENGQLAFRALERSALAEALSQPQSKILAAGGGALLSKEAEEILRSHPALVVYLDVYMDEILQRVGHGEGRPMLADQDRASWVNLYLQRQPRYQELADLTVDGNGPPEKVAAAIYQNLGLEERS